MLRSASYVKPIACRCVFGPKQDDGSDGCCVGEVGSESVNSQVQLTISVMSNYVGVDCDDAERAKVARIAPCRNSESWEFGLERRAGIEPASAGFADLSVSHFATGALRRD